MIRIERTNSKNQDFIDLVKQLDSELVIKDGDAHSFYNQFNSIDTMKHVVVVFENDIPMGCGAIKPYDSNTMEVKRMFTKPESRGKGIASIVLSELEKWASDLSYKKCILETGVTLYDAIGLYQKNGYKLIPNYGQYAEVETSKCFEKQIE